MEKSSQPTCYLIVHSAFIKSLISQNELHQFEYISILFYFLENMFKPTIRPVLTLNFKLYYVISAIETKGGNNLMWAR